MEHTKTPWAINTTLSHYISGTEVSPGLIAQCDAGDYARSIEEGEANADFIVLACNSHAALLKACKKYATHLDTCNLCSLIPLVKNGKKVCSCGFDKVQAAIDLAKKG